MSRPPLRLLEAGRRPARARARLNYGCLAAGVACLGFWGAVALLAVLELR